VTVVGALGCAALGLLVGLVLNVVIDRVPARQPLAPLRFRCPHLPRRRAPVAPDERDPQAEPAPVVAEPEEDPAETERPGLPLGAWVRPGGRCPVCGRRLPPRYFLVPLLSAVLFAAGAGRFGADWVLPAYLLLFAALVAISAVDLQLQIIPNRIVYPAIFASVPLLALAAWGDHEPSDLVRALLGGAAAWTALLLIHIISPGGMGFGDVRLSFLLGMFLGWLGYAYVMLGLFLGFLAGSVIGLLLVGLRIRKRTDHVPFGPFLAAGAILAILFGTPVVDAWLPR
jgi:leader peptidase (prepilin peptidase)/N-methyltransferase